MRILIAAFLLILATGASARVKSILDDFEGYADGQTSFGREGIFRFGDARLMAVQHVTTGYGYSGMRALRVMFAGQESFAGWGKGLGLLKEIDAQQDYLTFFILTSGVSGEHLRLQLMIEEDDDGSPDFDSGLDDRWIAETLIPVSGYWQAVSIPIREFNDHNAGGDGVFNASHDAGRLHTVAFSFADMTQVPRGAEVCFDFLCITDAPLVLPELFNPEPAEPGDFCVFGFWSEEGNSGNPEDIHHAFERLYGCFRPGKIGVVSFYKPFSVDGGKKENLLPEISQIRDLHRRGYLPMITFEAHHKIVRPDEPQPNLYSITEGWHDAYFAEWGKTIAQVGSPVLVRLLHEFNGDWYPWCIARNDRNTDLYIEAYRRIVDILRNNGAHNVRFVWCPNSISTPQESWNYFPDAYPGDAYVDFIGLDVFNGAGQAGVPQWRSFRHEATDAAYLARTLYPEKPLIICETSSRERMKEEAGHFTQKSDWIRGMVEALRTDLSDVRLVVWFNETPPFRIESSTESFGSFFKYFWLDDYFRASPDKLTD
jgi:hypothetical protein